jgi:general secretion pathway protein I
MTILANNSLDLTPTSFKSQYGFTLIEILVATMILAICIVVILQLFSGGLKSSRLSGDYTRAIFHAREKMEELLLLNELSDEVLEGEYKDGFTWRAKIQYIEPDKDEGAPLPVDTFNIVVEVSWPYGYREKHFEISTIKIAKKIAEDG